MATHEVTFPITDESEILKLRAGDEVVVQGHIIGIRDRTQIRIFDQGVEPPMDLAGAFLLHTAPNVRKLGPGKYEKLCIGTTTSARMVRFTEPLGAQYGVRAICGKGGFPDEAIEPMQRLGMVYFAIVGGAAALETTQIEEIEEVAWEELMPECLWKFRVKDFGPLTVGIDAHGGSLYHDVQAAAQKRAGGDLCPALTVPRRLPRPARAPRQAARRGPHARDRQGPRTSATSRACSTPRARSSTSSSSAGAPPTSRTTSRRRSRSTAQFETPVVCGGTLFEAVYARGRLDEYKRWLAEHRFAHVEISDGTLDIPRERKLELIADFARDFVVLSEVGSKDAEVVFAPYQWVEWIREELAAGAWKVVTEGREGGTAGIYRPTGEMRTGLARRDRPRDRRRRPDLRGADEDEPGLVREALRART